MSLPLGRWTNFLGTLGRLRRNRRQRQAAASRRRTAVRRHALQILEERVVLNADPVAEDDFLRIEPGQSVEISTAQLMANDTDADGDPLSPAAHSFKTAQGVIVSFDAQGHFVYHAPTGFVGTDTFKYWVDDGQAMSEAATVRIRVGNHAPTAVADEFTVVTGETLHFDEATLMADDTDADGDPLEFAGLRTPTAHGSLTWHADGSFDYVSDAGYVGLDTFQYQITDGEAISYGNVTIHVVAPNLAPTAGDDPLGDVYQGYSASGNVLANDTDPESNALSVEAFDGPVTGGHLMLQSNGAFIFTADAGYLGAGSFAYTVHDTAGNSAAATISWNVVPAPNLAPTGVNDDVGNVVQGQSAGGNVLANDTDPENDALSVDYFGGYVTGGYLTLQTNGDYSFTADGYSVGGGGYTYTLHDSAGNTSTATLSWNVVAPPNLAPTPQNDSMGDVVLGQTATGNLLSNDTDPENNALTVDTYGGPVYGGWLTINANGDYSYTAQGTLGAGSFGYTVRDTAGNSAGATLSWNVAAPNGAPTGVDDDTGDVTQGQQTTGNVLANDSDPENDALSVDYYVGLVSGGYLTLQTNGDYTFAADGTYLGAGSHTYTLHDSAGNTSTATLSWNVVAPPNQAPTAAADSFWVEIKSNNNDPFAFTAPGLLANDTDPENNTLSVVEQVDLATSGGGRVTLHADGSFDYTPPPAPFLGDDTFSYTVVDQHGAQAVGQVTVNVRPPAPPSIALYGGGLAEEGQKVTLVPVMLAYPFASYSYSMDWGDGHVDSGTAGNGTPAPTTFEHTYVDDDPTGTPFDIYGATLTVTDAYGQSMTTGSPTVVSNVAPTIVVNPYQAEINEGAGTVTVSGSVYDQGLNDQIHVRIVGENSVVLFDQIVAPGGTFEFSFTPDDDDFDPNDDSEDGSSADFNFTISAMDDDNGYAQDFNGHITVNNVDPQNVTGGDLGIYFCNEPEPTDDEIEAMVTAEDPGSDDLIASAGARTLVNFYFDTYGFYEEYSVTVSVKDDDSSPAVDTEVTYVVVHLIEWRLVSREKIGEYDDGEDYEINWDIEDDLDENGLVVDPGSILTNDSATVTMYYTHYETWREHWELVVVCDGTVIDDRDEDETIETPMEEELGDAELTAEGDVPPQYAKASPAWSVAADGTFTYEQDVELYDGPLDDWFTATITASYEGNTWTEMNWVWLNAPEIEPDVEVDLDTDSNNDGSIDDTDDGIEEEAPGRRFQADTGSAEIIVRAPENMPSGGVMRLYYDDGVFEIYSGGNYVNPGDEVSAGTLSVRAPQAGSGLVTLSYTPDEGEGAEDKVMLTAEDYHVDLDTDSNNDGTIDDVDDPIEEEEPGRRFRVGDQAELEIGSEAPQDGVLRLYYDDGQFEIYTAAGDYINPGDEVTAGSTVYAGAYQAGSDFVTLIYTPAEGETEEDKVRLTAEYPNVDLDTDSNNDGAINETDDPIEEDSPGRYMFVGASQSAEFNVGHTTLEEGESLILHYDSSLLAFYRDQALTDAIGDGDDVDPGMTIYAEALAGGETDVTLELESPEGEATLSDTVRVTNVSIDLDVDSNNDGTIDETDDTIEEDASLPGRVILANTLDSTGNGVPDYADGFDLFNNQGANRSVGFTQIMVSAAGITDLNQARIRLIYSEADPGAVTRTGTDAPEYAPGTDNSMRVWRRNGDQARTIAQDLVEDNRWYAVQDLLGGLSGQLFVEGVNPRDPSNESIFVELDMLGNGANIVRDLVMVTISGIQLWYTDVSGITHNAAAGQPALSVNRIAATEQPDGVATDWQAGVDDGATLLVRVLGTQVLADMLQNGGNLQINLGAIGQNGFQNLPANDGEFHALNDTTFAPNAAGQLNNLRDNGVPSAQFETDQATGRRVLAAQFYRPPNEFDVSNPNNPARERRINPAVQVTGALSAHGTKPTGLALVRPAVVTVHGINSFPQNWDTLDNQFDLNPSNFGFYTNSFNVDHTVADPAHPDEGATNGFGELSDMWIIVANMVGGAAQAFRDGQDGAGRTLFSGKNIAIQKVDIVAHSYGGLLSRWYIEQAPRNAGGAAGSAFQERRDVRKLVTLGTPHLGSPLANMILEAYRNPVIRNATIEGYGPFVEPTVAEVLEQLNAQGAQGLRTARDANFTNALRAYETLAVNSANLAALNTTPFNNDVSYASIVGTRESLTVPTPVGINVDINLFYALQPLYDPASEAEKAIFPWLNTFDGAAGASDGIVPVWSASFGQGPQTTTVAAANHVELPTNQNALDAVRNYLNNPMMLGSALRPGYTNQAPVSQRNAYVAQGLNPNAIIGVRLTQNPVYVQGLRNTNVPLEIWRADAAGATVHHPVLTGMVQVRDLANSSFILVSDGWTDDTLDNLGTLNLQQGGHIPQGQEIGGQLDWVAFRIEARLGLDATEGNIRGPSGYDTHADDETVNNETLYYHWLGYELTNTNSRQSAPTKLYTARYGSQELNTPTVTANANGTFTLNLTGTVVSVVAPGGGMAPVTLTVYDDDSIFGDDPLETVNVPINAPQDLYNGILLYYQASANLFVNNNGEIAGTAGSSGEASAEVYQETGGRDSETVTVP